MGLFLAQSEMWDMPLTRQTNVRSHPLTSADSNKRLRSNKPKTITHWFGNLCYVVFGALTKILFRYRVEHREKLRAFQDMGLVIVCCHTSFLDVAFIYLAARTKQWVRLMGRDTLFTRAGGLLGQVLSRVGAFPVKRDSADKTAIKRATKILKRGEIVGILPEGTRRGKSNKKPTLHAGAGFIAKMGRAPMMPMCVRNVELVKQKGKFIRLPKVTIEYGDPIVLSDFDFVDKKNRLEAYTWYAMRECFALRFNISREDVDMARLFPDTTDYKQMFVQHPIPVHDAVEYAAQLRAKREGDIESKKRAGNVGLAGDDAHAEVGTNTNRVMHSDRAGEPKVEIRAEQSCE